MAFLVMIVEDKPKLRNLLSQHLSDPFPTEAPYERSDWVKHAEEHLQVKALPEPKIEELVAAESEAEVRAVFDALKARPNLILTDLALSDEEVGALDERGGTEVSGAKDPTEQLQATTGFQILKAMAPDVPVIATTYASNPRVIEACWEAGAHAVIRKPANDEQMAACHTLWQYKDDPVVDLSESQKRKGRRWRRRIEAYLRALSQEVLKAIQAKALAEMQSVAPRQLPYWLALDDERLQGRWLEGTSLTMMEILGFSRLTELGMAKPKELFELVNVIWDEIQPLLAGSGAEINHFSGDVGLIFHGVYDEAERQCEVESVLSCAAAVSALFEREDKAPGPIRMNLIERIWELYDKGPRQEEMVRHVEGADFDVRIISIQPAENLALYGKVGASSRWQHTTLSPYFDLLQTARAEIRWLDRWLTREPEESFALFEKNRQPEIQGFEIKPLEALHSRGSSPYRRELLGWKVHRVLKAAEREYA